MTVNTASEAIYVMRVSQHNEDKTLCCSTSGLHTWVQIILFGMASKRWHPTQQNSRTRHHLSSTCDCTPTHITHNSAARPAQHCFLCLVRTTHT